MKMSLFLNKLVFSAILTLAMFLQTTTPILADSTPQPAVNITDPKTMRDIISKTIGLNIRGGSAITTPGSILTAFFPFMFVFAGLTLFVMIVWGGFEMLLGAADTKAQEAGKQRITWAAIGFVLLFTAYWIGQILEIVFKINIFSLPVQ